MPCCGFYPLARLGDFFKGLFSKEEPYVPNRYSYMETVSDSDVTTRRVQRPLSPRKSGGPVPAIPFMFSQPGEEPTHVETIHGRSTPPEYMERSRWYGE
jgi:hypothetical protein